MTPSRPSQPPRSGVHGILWPAFPHPVNAQAFALLYQMDQSQWWEPERLTALQLRQAGLLVAHCLEHNAFYRERLGYLKRGGGPGLSMEEFATIPILSRRDVQRQGARLSSSDLPKTHLPRGSGRSSGSTGRPIEFHYTRVTGQIYRALNMRFHFWHKNDFTGKVAAIRKPRLANNDGVRGSAATWLGGYRTGPFVELTPELPVAEQLQWLSEEKPNHLVTYPTNLLALIDHARRSGMELPRLDGIDTIGEVCTAEVRDQARGQWGHNPRDIYSCMENGILAMQCPEHDTYHVQSDSVILEVLDDRDQPCGPGEVGRVVVTDLHNFATPFIRYALGDYAEAGAPCPCGRTLPVLNRIMGRTRNMLVLPNGDQIWPVMSKIPWSQPALLSQFQIIQHNLNEIEAKVVLSRPSTAEEQIEITRNLDTFFSGTFQVRLTVCDEIPRAPSGKFEDCLSLVRSPE